MFVKMIQLEFKLQAHNINKKKQLKENLKKKQLEVKSISNPENKIKKLKQYDDNRLE